MVLPCTERTHALFALRNKVVWLQFDGLVFVVSLNILILQFLILNQGLCILGYDTVCSGGKVSENGLLSVVYRGNVNNTFQKKVGKFLPDYTVSLLRGQ
jgi:hypothetical protein